MTDKVTFWITSTGRNYVVPCIEEFLKHNTYPNFELLIYESDPSSKHIQMFYDLDCPKRVWVGDWPKLGWVYNHLFRHTEQYFVRVDDDCWPACDPGDMLTDGINLLKEQPLQRPMSHVAMDMNPRIAWNPETNVTCPAVSTDINFKGVVQTKGGPVMGFTNPAGISLVDKKRLGTSFSDDDAPWNGAEMRHIEYLRRHGLWTGYMMWWWGVYGHFGAVSSEGHDRSYSSEGYQSYIDEKLYGRRPVDEYNRYVPKHKSEITEDTEEIRKKWPGFATPSCYKRI